MTAHNTIEFSGHAWKHGFTMVPNHILESQDLSGGAKLTFVLLMKFGRDKARAFPGQVRMSRLAGCSEKTLRGHITELTERGLVAVKRRGQGKTNLYILHPDRELLPPGSVAATDLGGSSATGEEEAEEEDTDTRDATRPSDQDEPQMLYDAFLAKIQGQPPRPITPSLRRTAEKALQEYGLTELSGPALDGFKAWRQKKPGDKRFSSIFASHPGGRPLHDHIGFWISQGGDASGLSGFPSEVRVKIVRAVRDVQRGHGSRDTDTVQQATESMEYLRSKGIESVPGKDGAPTFPALGAES